MIIPSHRRTNAIPAAWVVHSVLTSPPLPTSNSGLSLWPIDEKLYLGHGNWTSNLGPTSVLSIGPEGDLINHLPAAPTEAFNVFREIDGAIYAPYTDPQGATQGAYGGYATNAGGTWRAVKMNLPMVHCFDIVKTSHGLFMTGSARAVNGTTEPIVVKSTDGGTVWTEVHHSERWALGRYYGIVAEGDTIFVRHSNAQQPVEASSDGGLTWKSVSRPDLHNSLSSGGYDDPPETITDWTVFPPSGATKPVRMGDKAYCCAQTGTSVTIYRRPAPPTS